MEKFLKKGRIQEILKGIDSSKQNLGTNVGLRSALNQLGIIELYTTNENTKNTIVSALRKFKNLKIGSRRRNQPIKPGTIIGYEKSRTNYTRQRRKVRPDSIRYPWIMLEISNGEPVVKSVHVPGYSSAKGWEINWVKNVPFMAFPLSKIQEVFNAAITSSNNRVKSQTVGKVCKAGYDVLKSRCGDPEVSIAGTWNRRNVRNKYATIYNSSTKSYNTYKNGISGLSVDQLAKIIIRIGKTNAKNRAKARADFLELKRNGDYGEVFTVYDLNLNLEKCIMKPGDIKLAQEILDNGGNIPDSLNSVSDKNFYYTRGCFWSTDRPALFLCILLNVPFVRVIGRTYHFNLTNPFSKLKEILGYNRSRRPLNEAFPYNATTDGTVSKPNYEAACDILDNIIADRGVGQPNYNNMWFLKMCVIDTAHDFGNDSARAKMAASRQQRFMMRDIMIRMGERRIALGAQWNVFVKSVWSAKSVEFVMGKIINAISIQTSSADQTKYQQSNKQNPLNILNILDENDMCIIWDSGSSPPGELIHRTALAAAKFLDPAP
jgi:hypothetical protein